jgi:hypothetical protein
MYDYLCIDSDADIDSKQHIETMCYMTVSSFSKAEVRERLSGNIMTLFQVLKSYTRVLSNEMRISGYEM